MKIEIKKETTYFDLELLHYFVISIDFVFQSRNFIFSYAELAYQLRLLASQLAGYFLLFLLYS